MTRRPTAIGINIFGGGFTLGVQRAGFEVLGQWEECDAHRRTFDMNFSGIPHPLRYAEWPLLDAPRVDLVYANPPCAPWSSAAAANGVMCQGYSDPRLAMTARTMETALSMEPRVFVLESVPGAFTRGRAYYNVWAEKFMAVGYGVTYWLTDAILHGSPSERQRFHFIAHKRALRLEEPDMRRFVPKTVRSAIGDIANTFGQLPQHAPFRRDTSDAYYQMIEETEPGGKLRTAAETRQMMGQEVRMAPFIARRLFWDSPALTIVKVAETAHPSRARYLTTREGLRMLNYPDNFVVFDERYPVSATQAVMPLMGECLARLAVVSLGEQPARRELEVVDWRDFARPYRQTAVIAGLRDAGEWPPAVDETPRGDVAVEEDELTGEQVMTCDGVEASRARLPLDAAIECFGANWPRLAQRLDEHRSDWLTGARASLQEARSSRPTASPRATRPGSGLRFRELIRSGATNAEALAAVRAEFPESRATLSDAAWNRQRVRREDGAATAAPSGRADFGELL